jgi:hypothetical protein
VRFEFESGIVSFCFFFIFVSFGESCLLVSWCAVGRCSMACSDEYRGRSKRPGAEDRGWSHRSSTRWPGDREGHTPFREEGTKPPYVCPGCSNHTHGNNMINRENVTNKQVLFLT